MNNKILFFILLAAGLSANLNTNQEALEKVIQFSKSNKLMTTSGVAAIIVSFETIRMPQNIKEVSVALKNLASKERRSEALKTLYKHKLLTASI